MIYRKIIVPRRGGPDVMEVAEEELRLPHPGEARIRVLATPVCAPDITARRGQSPFTPRMPFTPGYAIIGVIDAVGDAADSRKSVVIGDRVGALTTYGGYSEYIYLPVRKLFPVPADLHPGEAVPIILNYIVAYHAMHRWAKAQPGEIALILGASGGIGTACLQLGRMAGLKMYGTASKTKHSILEEFGAVPIDYRSQDFVSFLHQREPNGLDIVLDGMAGDFYPRGYSLLRRGGRIVGFGNPGSVRATVQMLSRVALYRLRPDGKSASYYSTGVSYFQWQRFLDDWAVLFRWMQEGRIRPVIQKQFPLLEAAQANALLESGNAVGNVVLVSPDYL
jgi:NADPH:quinone reductase-like Zn-dependent oxidoreductase